VVVCILGGESWDEEEGGEIRGRGGEGRQHGDILAFTDGIPDGHIMLVYSSVILTMNGSHHCTNILV